MRAAAAHQAFSARTRSLKAVDAVIASAALAGSLAQLSHGGIPGWRTGPGELDLVGGALAACSTAPLIAWRCAPRAVFAFTACAAIVLGALGYPLVLALGAAAALFLLAVSRDDDDPWTRRDTGIAAALFAGYLAASAAGDGDLPASELLHTGLAWSVAWFAGDRARLRHEHMAELAERAVRSERDAERERLLAVAEERARIARDLHDSAGHAINVVAVRAGTARMRRDPERSQAALEAIEELARKTADEIDHIVGALRDRGADGGVEAPPGLASFGTLIERHAASGLEVTASTEGEERPLETAVDQAAYRILQEALTNASRHGGDEVRVKIAYGESAVELAVINPVAAETGARANGGHGLIGMRERAALLGGGLEAERAGGWFRIRARLPYGGSTR